MFLTASYFIFHFFSGFSVICSLMVVSAKNPIHSVLFLILTFFNLSCLLFILNVEFLPLLFLIVYVGAIAVLFLFVLIMLNIKLSELKEGSKQYFFIALIFGIIFGLNTLFGSIIIILTSLYILRREAKVKENKEQNLQEI